MQNQTVQLKMTPLKALSLYSTASQEFKELLEESFGKDFFSLKITERVKTFDDILAISGQTMSSLINENDTSDEIAYKQAKLIAKVYNEGKELDASNTSQYKYYPWHKIAKDSSKPSGFGLSYDACAYWYAHSFVGVRLCFINAELAKDAGVKFIEIYENLKIK